MCWWVWIQCSASQDRMLSQRIPGWGPDQNLLLIRLSRPKLSLIRISRRKFTLIRLSRPKWTLIRLCRHRRSLTRLFRPKVFWSDHLQTMVQTQIQTIAQTLIRLWSDSNALEEGMIKPSCARSSYDQTELRLQLFMIDRLKCAPNRFWSDSSALEIVWSETDFTYEKIS